MEASDDEFYKALVGEDELGRLVRGHLFLEQEMWALARFVFKFPDQLDGARLRFPQLVHVLSAIGLDRDFVPPLLEINTLRNRFAHNLGATFGEKEWCQVWGRCSERERHVMRNSFLRSGRDYGLDSEKLGPADKLVLKIVTLRQGIRAARYQAGDNSVQHRPATTTK